MEQTDFYLNLPSNTFTSQQFKRQNTTSHFRVRLPHDIRLTGKWEVALVELQYPYSWNNVSDDLGSNDLQNNQLMFVNQAQKHAFTVNIWPAYYESVDQLIRAIAEEKDQEVKNNAYLIEKGVSAAERQSILEMFNFDVDYIRKRVCFDSDGYTAFLSDKLQYMLGYKHNIVPPGKYAEYAPDMRAGIDALYVYCDLCEPQIVGDTQEPLLRIVPVHGKHGEIISRVFVGPHYTNVLRKEFSTVEITIKTDADRPIPFEYGKCIVKLHLRKKRSI